MTRGNRIKKRLFLQISFLVLITMGFLGALWHLQVSSNMIIWGIEQTDGVLHISTKKAELLSLYTLVAIFIVYNIFVVYLILNQTD